ncbi:nitroreductase family protein [Dehalococcoidia bacterium]|nr:nitroreductase family protein [Dehalococcoidia bacterium]
MTVAGKTKQRGKGSLTILIVTLATASLLLGCLLPRKKPALRRISPEIELRLPEPRHDSDVSIEQTLLRRRSVRDYSGEVLTLQEVSQLLWAAQGITDRKGFRTTPSGRATYALDAYLVVGDVENLAPGVYRYEPPEHKMVKVLEGDLRAGLAGVSNHLSR